MSARTEGFTPRSEAAWTRRAAAALPDAAAGLYQSAHAIDPADAFISACDRLNPDQADSAARRAKGFDSFSCAVRIRKGGFIHTDRNDRGEIVKTRKKWVGQVHAVSHLGEPIDLDDPLSMLEAREAATSISAAIEAGDAEMQRLEAQAVLDEADTAAIAKRDGVGVRMVQLALQTQRAALKHGQGVLL